MSYFILKKGFLDFCSLEKRMEVDEFFDEGENAWTLIWKGENLSIFKDVQEYRNDKESLFGYRKTLSRLYWSYSYLNRC